MRANKDDLLQEYQRAAAEENESPITAINLDTLVIPDSDPKLETLQKYFPFGVNGQERISRIKLKELLLKYYSQKDLKILLAKRKQGGLNPYDGEALNDVESFMSRYVKS
jgi:hypothetical protein